MSLTHHWVTVGVLGAETRDGRVLDEIVLPRHGRTVVFDRRFGHLHKSRNPTVLVRLRGSDVEALVPRWWLGGALHMELDPPSDPTSNALGWFGVAYLRSLVRTSAPPAWEGIRWYP